MGTERQVGDRQGHLGQGPGAQGQQALRGQGGMWVSGGVWEEEGRMAKSTPALEGRKEVLIVGAFPPKSLPKLNPARA